MLPNLLRRKTGDTRPVLSMESSFNDAIVQLRQDANRPSRILQGSPSVCRTHRNIFVQDKEGKKHRGVLRNSVFDRESVGYTDGNFGDCAARSSGAGFPGAPKPSFVARCKSGIWGFGLVEWRAEPVVGKVAEGSGSGMAGFRSEAGLRRKRSGSLGRIPADCPFEGHARREGRGWTSAVLCWSAEKLLVSPRGFGGVRTNLPECVWGP